MVETVQKQVEVPQVREKGCHRMVWWIYSGISMGIDGAKGTFLMSSKSERGKKLLGGDWNMTFIFPFIGNDHTN